MERDSSSRLDAVRDLISDAIEALLALADAIDGDPDQEDDEREPDNDDEGGGDAEPEDRL